MYDTGSTQQKNFHLQKVDGGQSGSQNWRKTSKFQNIYTFIISIIKRNSLALEGIQVEF